jgi:iron complex transport system substrate-binding protein
MRRTLATFAAALLAAAGLAACGTKPAPSPSPTGAPAAQFPVTVGSLTLTRRPTRVVSLSPTATEMLFAVNAGSQVVAVDELSTYPSSAPRTKLSGYKPNVEAVAAYNPDLVVVSDDTGNIVEQLGTLKIPVYVAPAAKTLDDSYAQIDALGALTGHRADAAAEVSNMRDEIAKLVHDLPAHGELTYYYELDQTYYSLTTDTFVGALFALAGLKNIADASGTADNPYPQLSAEVIVKADPDLIFLADSKCCGQSATTVAKRAGWSGIAAVRNGQVIALDDDVASRWGPRVVDLFRTITGAVAKARVG